MATKWAQLRRIMYEPSTVWLSTDDGGVRWLTDQFVLYDATNLEELYCYDCSYDVVWPDGAYQLTVSQGFKPRDSVPEPDIEAWLQKAEAGAWVPADPTEWSVAEHPGKAMLWVANMNIPCLIGESTWTEVRRYHPDAIVEWAPNKGAGTFRFSEVRHDGCDEDDFTYCGHRPIPFAYAAGIRVPDGQEVVADAIVKAALKVPVEAELVDVVDAEVIEEAA